LDNRLRIQNSEVLDDTIQIAILEFDRELLISLFDKFDAAVAACNIIAEIFEDPHLIARNNIIAVEDEELGGPLKIKNVVGKFSRTPGKIRHAGLKLGGHNFELLVNKLGFDQGLLLEEGHEIDNTK
jgi:crotonobetainyl-CoA:carnitine CoA-transferase CaiB-like acyl-CoA transferase